MELFTSTRAVGAQLLRDVERILYWTTIVVQVIFLAFNGYSIYKNLDHLALLITYIALTLLTLVNLVFYLATYKNKKNSTVKQTKSIFRFSKYIINFAMLAIKITDLLIYGGTDLDIILIAVSSISLVLQIILEITRKFVQTYVDKFTIAFKQDIQPVIKFVNAPKKLKEVGIKFKGQVGGKVLGLVNAPLEYITNKVNNTPKLSKQEQEIKDLTEQYKAQQKEKKRIEDAELNSKYNEKVVQEKTNIKENFNIIANKVGSFFKNRNSQNSKQNNLELDEDSYKVTNNSDKNN